MSDLNYATREEIDRASRDIATIRSDIDRFMGKMETTVNLILDEFKELNEIKSDLNRLRTELEVVKNQKSELNLKMDGLSERIKDVAAQNTDTHERQALNAVEIQHICDHIKEIKLMHDDLKDDLNNRLDDLEGKVDDNTRKVDKVFTTKTVIISAIGVLATAVAAITGFLPLFNK